MTSTPPSLRTMKLPRIAPSMATGSSRSATLAGPPQSRLIHPTKTTHLRADPPQDPNLPSTSPGTPWDRIVFTCSPKTRPLWAGEEPPLSEPLPPQARIPEAFLAGIVIHAIEILQGHRPPAQLHHWLTSEVYYALRRRAALAMRIVGPAPRTSTPVVQRLRHSHPQPRAIEAAVVVFDGKKTRAAALRVEYRRARWIVTALEIA